MTQHQVIRDSAAVSLLVDPFSEGYYVSVLRKEPELYERAAVFGPALTDAEVETLFSSLEAGLSLPEALAEVGAA